jgi:hypothetical protein
MRSTFFSENLQESHKRRIINEQQYCTSAWCIVRKTYGHKTEGGSEVLQKRQARPREI